MAQSTLPYSSTILVKSLVGVGVGVILIEGVLEGVLVIDGVILTVAEGVTEVALHKVKSTSTTPAPVPV